MATNDLEKPVYDEQKDDEVINQVPLTGDPAELLKNPKIIDQLFKKDANGNLILQAGIIDGADVFANNFRNKKNTIDFLLGNVSVASGGWTTSISAGGTLSGLGSNQMLLSLASALIEESYINSQGYGIVLGDTSEQAVQWNYNPSLEFWARCEIAGTNPYAKVRMGASPNNNFSYIGWTFEVVAGTVRPKTRGYNPGGPEAMIAYTLSDIDASDWHKYRIEVAKTNPSTYSVTWFVDDVSYITQIFSSEWTTTATGFSAYVTNNVTDISETVALSIAQARFQQNYS
jgi:hypothetical protein